MNLFGSTKTMQFMSTFYAI